MYSFSLLKFVKEEGEDREGRREKGEGRREKEKEKGEGRRGKKGLGMGKCHSLWRFLLFFFISLIMYL